MPHTFLFYLERIEQNPVRLELDGDEHHHLAAVLRIRPGERIFVTDGAGRMFSCTVSLVEKHRTALDVSGKIEPERQVRQTTIALSCIKKERFERAVAQCTELGMVRCIPFSSEKSSLKRYTGQYLDRLRAIALSSMKQSFGSILPAIEPPVDFTGLLSALNDYEDVRVGSQDAEALDAGSLGTRVLIVIGPEAGFSTEETGRLHDAGCVFASVSSRRLRSDTAAAAMLSIINRPFRDRQTD